MLLSENYEGLSKMYENFEVEVDRRIEKCKGEAAEAKGRLRNVMIEKEELKKSYQEYKGKVEKNGNTDSKRLMHLVVGDGIWQSTWSRGSQAIDSQHQEHLRTLGLIPPFLQL